MRNRKPAMLAAIILVGLLPCLIACLMQQPQPGKKTGARYRIYRVYLGDSEVPVPGPVCVLPKGKSVVLAESWGGPVSFRSPDKPPLVTYSCRQDFPTVDKDGNKLRPYAAYHELILETASKEYPVELSLKYVAGTSQFKEPIMVIRNKITIQKPRETHVLRSEDGQWMILFEWYDE